MREETPQARAFGAPAVPYLQVNERGEVREGRQFLHATKPEGLQRGWEGETRRRGRRQIAGEELEATINNQGMERGQSLEAASISAVG